MEYFTIYEYKEIKELNENGEIIITGYDLKYIDSTPYTLIISNKYGVQQKHINDYVATYDEKNDTYKVNHKINGNIILLKDTFTD